MSEAEVQVAVGLGVPAGGAGSDDRGQAHKGLASTAKPRSQFVTSPRATRHEPWHYIRDVRFLVLFALMLGCNSSPPPESAAPPAPEPEEVEHDHQYSPFTVHMHQEELPFGVISFKDVGMSLPNDERAFVYESLAQSLAMQLTTSAELSSEVQHTVEILDPAAHAFCEGRHIYVDLWQAGEGWGYSLWSGCGEDDRFAHRELASRVVEQDDRIATLEPLVADIADSLRSALQTGCFTRHC